MDRRGFRPIMVWNVWKRPCKVAVGCAPKPQVGLALCAEPYSISRTEMLAHDRKVPGRWKKVHVKGHFRKITKRKRR